MKAKFIGNLFNAIGLINLQPLHCSIWISFIISKKKNKKKKKKSGLLPINFKLKSAHINTTQVSVYLV